MLNCFFLFLPPSKPGKADAISTFKWQKISLFMKSRHVPSCILSTEHLSQTFFSTSLTFYLACNFSGHRIILHGSSIPSVNPCNTELFNLNFQSPEFVSRYRDPQIQEIENLCDLWNLSPITYISVSRLQVYFTMNSSLSGVMHKGANKKHSRHQCSKC